MTHVTAMTISNEPGVMYYAFAKGVEDPDSYVVVEVYRDQAACAAHGETAWVQESIPKYLGLIEGMPSSCNTSARVKLPWRRGSRSSHDRVVPGDRAEV